MASEVITVSVDELERQRLAKAFRQANPYTPLADQHLDCVSEMNVVVARARRQQAVDLGLTWAVEDIGNSEHAAALAVH